jgi:hypothetical protein
MNLLHTAIWPRVKNTHGHLFLICNLPCCHQDTWLVGRVATITATVDTRRIAAIFCSAGSGSKEDFSLSSHFHFFAFFLFIFLMN